MEICGATVIEQCRTHVHILNTVGSTVTQNFCLTLKTLWTVDIPF